jgi:antitoxin component of RelBE/YafQ-DinJ toxin-antitoxin module
LLADAGAEGMNIDISQALALALVKNTDGVLAILDDRIIPISTNEVCSLPLYNMTIPEENVYVVKAIQALYKSNSVQAQKCLQELITTVGQSDPS